LDKEVIGLPLANAGGLYYQRRLFVNRNRNGNQFGHVPVIAGWFPRSDEVADQIHLGGSTLSPPMPAVAITFSWWWVFKLRIAVTINPQRKGVKHEN